MWKEYAPHGLAICSRYGLLKSALNGLLDEVHFGRVAYGKDTLPRPGNALCEIATKGSDFSWECEIRALLYWPSALSAGNLRIGGDNNVHPRVLPENEQYRYPWNPDHKLRRIDLKTLVTGIVISPWAAQETIDEVIFG
jgi:hypothetical protein